MSRETRSVEEINSMIREEMRRHEECADIALRSVYWHEPDSTGCNWDAHMWDEAPDKAFACRDKIVEVVKDLRAKYNIPHEG